MQRIQIYDYNDCYHLDVHDSCVGHSACDVLELPEVVEYITLTLEKWRERGERKVPLAPDGEREPADVYDD